MCRYALEYFPVLVFDQVLEIANIIRLRNLKLEGTSDVIV